MDRDWAETTEMIGRGEPSPDENRVRYIWNSANNAKTSAEAVNLLFTATGARAVNERNAMQRYRRDATVIPNHILMSAYHWGAMFAWITLGGDPGDAAL